ncbi:Hepatocyte nuclear factor 6 [Echinococcus granulosus]|uniref:One cut domain family member n=1 Tax=Echinococcus granulosus TaxID=6210 RepID=A0A068WZQ2_ECHGR|nr:Hepatocyte nuclear factor 6 [Echinococcus granulosus]CDS23148.1 Onecut [Echinococcus granulosus]
MDFSISQFTGEAGISEAKASPLALVKNDFADTDVSISYASTTETAEIFQHLPTNMYANIVSGYPRSEAYSSTCFPYAHVNPVMTTASGGMPFFPYVGTIDQQSLHSQHHQQEVEEERLKSTCSTSQMPAGTESEQNCYYSTETQEYATEDEQITNVNEAYKYETLNNFKDTDEEEEVLETRLDEALPDWATSSTMMNTSTEGMVQSAEVSRTSTNQTYTSATEHEGLLDCSNRSSDSKTYDETGGDYCSTDQSLSVSQDQQHQIQNTDPSFQESSAVYMTSEMPIAENQQPNYPPNVTCAQSSLMPPMFPYQYLSSGFTGDQNTSPMEGIVSQNFVFSNQSASTINPYTGELANPHALRMSSEAMESSIDKALFTHPDSAGPVDSWTGFQKGMVANALASQSHNDLQLGQMSDSEELNTKELAQRVSAELKRYSIPQAVFAQRVLCRSQGTLSDLLRNPKPWSKLKSGRETFRRMWKWLQEPEYQRMSALRLAGKYLQNSTSKRKDHEIMPGVGNEEIRVIKKPRLVFTDIQRRTLHAIFKETKRPSKEMQATIAHQLGLEISTVANFFMNARRRSLEKWQDGGDSKNSSIIDSSSPQSSADPSESLAASNEDATSIAHLSGSAYAQSGITAASYPSTDQTSMYAAVSVVSCQASNQMYVQQPDYTFASSQQNFLPTQREQRIHPYAKTRGPSTFQSQYFTHYQQEQQPPLSSPPPPPPQVVVQRLPRQPQPPIPHQQQSSSLFDLRRLASASQLDPRFLATATELSASHQSLRDQALEICSNMAAAAAAAAANAKFNTVASSTERQFLKQEAETVVEQEEEYLAER